MKNILKMNTLGKVLKSSRSNIGLTLRQIEEVSGISNAYLSQLENDKIKQPSANILYKISKIYKVELNDLLYAAGIIQDAPKKSNINDLDFIQKIAYSADNLNESQKERVLEYLNFIKQSKDN